MSYSIFFGIIIQSICATILWRRLKWNILQYTGALFLLMVFVYHGFTEILNAVFPGRNSYRELVSDEMVDSTVLLFSLAICIYLFSYFMFLRIKGPLRFKSESAEKAKAVLNSNIPLLLVVTAVCYIVKFYYKMAVGFDEVATSSDEYWIYGLATYLFPYLLLISTVSLIVLRPAIPAHVVLFIQILIGITFVSRMTVLFTLANTMIIAHALGYTFDKRKMAALFAITLVVLVLISIGRGVFGRYELAEMRPGERLESIVSSAKAEDAEASEHILNDFVYRTDANAPNALILESLMSGYEPAGLLPIFVDLYLQIPRALNPSKLESDVLSRNAKAFTFAYFGHDPTIDYLQGWLGYFLGCFGIWGLLLTMAILGVLFAALDLWFIRARTSFSIVIYYILIANILYYEGVFQALLGSTRSIMIIIICMALYHFASRAIFHRRTTVSQLL